MRKIAIVVLFAIMAAALAACTIVPNTPPNTPPLNEDVTITLLAGEGLFPDGKTSVNVNPDTNGKVTLKDEPRKDGYAFAG